MLGHRRLLAALLTGVAVLAGVRAVAPPPPPTVELVVAAHDLDAGVALTEEDVAVRRVPPGAAPDAALPAPAVVGRTLAAPLRAGEPVTDVRLLGGPLASAYDGRRVLPVRFPDADQVGLLQVGDRLDVLATPSRGRGAEVVASDVLVAALPAGGPDEVGALPGRVVLLAVPETAVSRVTEAAAREYLSYVYVH